MRLRSLIAIVLLGAVAMSATGCQKVLDVLTPPAIVKTVTVKAKVGAPDAQVTGKLKSGYPSNLPLWAGAAVLKSAVVKSDVGDSWSATLSTPDPYNDVVNGMVTGFQKQGWTAEQADITSSGASTTVITIASDTGSGVVTIVAKKDNTTNIGYVIQSSGK